MVLLFCHMHQCMYSWCNCVFYFCYLPFFLGHTAVSKVTDMGYVTVETWFSSWCQCDISIQLKQFRKALSCVQHTSFSPWCNNWGVQLTAHLYLMAWLRMCGIKELYLHQWQAAACMLSWHAQGQMYRVPFSVSY